MQTISSLNQQMVEIKATNTKQIEQITIELTKERLKAANIEGFKTSGSKESLNSNNSQQELRIK